jgi:hypothetical protein
MSKIYIFPKDFELNSEKIDIKGIRFSDTILKINESNIIDIYYKNKPLYIQLPIYKIQTITESTLILIVDSIFINLLIKPLEQHVINYLYKNSEKIFGKNFTMNKIIHSIIPITFPESNEESTLNIKITNNSLYKSLIELNECNSGDSIICLIKINSLQFIKNKFTIVFELQQAKILKEENLINYSIIS